MEFIQEFLPLILLQFCLVFSASEECKETEFHFEKSEEFITIIVIPGKGDEFI